MGGHSTHDIDRLGQLGKTSLGLGILAVLGVLWMWFLSDVSAATFDPPNWLRILGLAFIPVGLIGGVMTGLMGLKGLGRPWAVGGLVASTVAIVAFIVIYNAYG